MSKNVLFVCTYGDFLTSFELSNISIYQKNGYNVHCACNFLDGNMNKKNSVLRSMGCVLHQVNFSRKIDFTFILNIKKIKEIVTSNCINVIDCHNAVCSAIARFAVRKNKLLKVIYTPHSLFFDKNSPLKNRIIYKPVEYYLAHYTDLIILINKEDYKSSKKMKLRGKAIYVPGVGIDLKKINNIMCSGFLHKEYSITNDCITLLSVGELNSNKNHESVIRALSKIEFKQYKYFICGLGSKEDYLKKLIKQMNLQDNVFLIGYRDDVISLMKECDAFVFPSFREGLSVALMESMATGKYVICSQIKGNEDLISSKSGEMFNPNNIEEIKRCLLHLFNNKNKCIKSGLLNKEIIKKYDIQNVHGIMVREYAKYI